ncbi:CHASE domain-containing protein [Uliginosibacterium sp. TH139]|uniref:CHASE domain-containing protein n=1 Tax=Uliginosibacterium sp. TH139 TaxID=2067453 RepID=UPI000C7D95A7|nr:CHASE domain-containing protein [Uliginosibacterium sp. TH139]PLK49619.1 hypothetical protein C0V76_04090 [Uliginosibacterium sp. TH139]
MRQLSGSLADAEVRRRLRDAIPWLVLMFGLILSLVAWQSLLRYVEGVRQHTFELRVADAHRLIEERIDAYRQILLGATGLLQASDEVTREEFSTYYRGLDLERRYPGILGVGYIELVHRHELTNHERLMRQSGLGEYRVRPEGDRARYAPIVFGEPWSRAAQERVLGLDQFIEPIRSEAMALAVDSASSSITGRVRLFLDGGEDRPSVMMFAPVYLSGVPLESLSERRRAIRGFMFTAFRVAELMEGIFGHQENRLLHLQLFDGADTRPAHLLYASDSAKELALAARNDLVIQVQLELPGRQWQAVFTPNENFMSETADKLPEVVLASGILTSFLLFALLLVGARSSRLVIAQAEAKAREMTVDLRKSEARFRQVIDASPSGIVMVDRRGRMSLLNGRLEAMFGHAEGSLLGQPLETLLPEGARALHQRLREGFEEAPVMRLMGQGRYLTGLRADGSEFPLEIALSPVDTSEGHQTLAMVSDVTARYSAEQRIEATQNLLQAIINAASEFSIVASDKDGLITVFNTGAERMLGYPAGELIGCATPAIFHLPDELRCRGAELSQQTGLLIEGYEVFVHKARCGEAEAREWTYVRKDGSTLAVMLTVTALRNVQGEISGFMGIAYDISARKQTERMQREAREAAESASRSKSEFLANMSHEIRTPLNAVLGMAQVLGFGRLDAEQREQLRLIEVSGKALLGILNDILDFSKIEAGRMELAPVPFHLSDLCDALAGIMAVSAADKDIDLHIQVDPALPRILLGDQLRLQQILVNLAGNAIKFTGNGEVSVGIGLLQREGDEIILRCEVRDTGIGMSEEQIGRLFAPFTQADTSTTRRYGGSGLGLVICKRLVEMMGGSIGVTSMPGQGSRFKFTVRMQALAGGQASQTPPLQGLQIQDLLVVDGSDSSSGALVAAAEALGVSCESCASESEAMARVITRGRNPDIVLIDWNMPDRGRGRLLQQLSQRKPDALPPIVLAVSSAHGRDQLNADPLLVSLDGVLIKPVTSSTLLDSVMQACSRRDNNRDLRRIMQLPEVQLRARSLRGARLLLVEDNAINQMVARGILQQAGAILDVAGNGQEALDRLRAHPELYVAILMDVQMPVMDGCTATRLLRSELGIKLPVIAMTAGVLQRQREECMAAGMNDFLSKPLDAVLTIETLERALGHSLSHTVAASPEDAGESTPAGEVIAISGLETSEALARIGNNQALFRELLLQFCIEATPLPEALRHHLEQGRFKDAGRIFHTLKSTAANIGANALSEQARLGEVGMQQGDADAALAALNAIEISLDLLLPAMTAHLETRKQATSPASGADRVALQQLLRQLHQHDMDALDSFEYLRAGLPGACGAELAEQLTVLISALDFDAAAQLLEGLLAEA